MLCCGGSIESLFRTVVYEALSQFMRLCYDAEHYLVFHFVVCNNAAFDSISEPAHEFLRTNVHAKHRRSRHIERTATCIRACGELILALSGRQELRSCRERGSKGNRSAISARYSPDGRSPSYDSDWNDIFAAYHLAASSSETAVRCAAHVDSVNMSNITITRRAATSTVVSVFDTRIGPNKACPED